VGTEPRCGDPAAADCTSIEGPTDIWRNMCPELQHCTRAFYWAMANLGPQIANQPALKFVFQSRFFVRSEIFQMQQQLLPGSERRRPVNLGDGYLSTSIIKPAKRRVQGFSVQRGRAKNFSRGSISEAPEEEILLVESAGSSVRQSGSSSEGKTLRFPYLVWLLYLLICTLVMAAAFVYFDLPIARRVYGSFVSAQSLATGFASAVLLGSEAAVALALIMIRIARGHLSSLREATLVACLTSICAYAINDSTLKFFFGVANPMAVLHGARHALNFLSGSSSSSFPSGHMVLAGAFAGVFMRLYRTSILPLSALLLIAAVLLVVGDWHFVSDVIAGTFLGISAGLLSGEVWLAHSK
jgi:membrane-associated phospholipid phosphatase